MPIQIESENLYEAQSLSSIPSPFVMSFITWLSAMVGSALLFLSTNQMTLLNRAYVRTVIPVMTMGVSSFTLALVVTLTTMQWEVFFMSWFFSWFICVCLSWFFLGMFLNSWSFSPGDYPSSCFLSTSIERNNDSSDMQLQNGLSLLALQFHLTPLEVLIAL